MSRLLARCVCALALATAVSACGRDAGRPAPASASATAAADSAAAAMIASGIEIYFAAGYDSARVLLQRALEAAGAADDSVTYADALTWLGLSAFRQGRFADARLLGEQALELKHRHGERELSRSYNALGLLAMSEGRLDDAMALYSRSIDVARDAGDSVAIGRGLNNRALVLFELGDFEGARRGYEALLELASAAGERRGEAIALANLAMHHVRLGDPFRAIPLLERARLLYAEVDHPVGEENALGQLGSAYDRMGDPHRAIAYLDSALIHARRHGLRQQQVENLGLLAALFGQLGDHSRALDLLVQARSISGELGQVAELGDLVRTEARTYAALGRRDLAIQRATEAVRLHRASSARFKELLDVLTVAELEQHEQRVRPADRALDAGRVLARRLDAPVAHGLVALSAARVLDSRGDAAAVLATLRGAEPELAQLGAGVEWEARALEARAHTRLGQLEEAAEAGRAAVQAIERVRGRIHAGPMRTSFTAHRAAVYGDLVVTLLLLGRTDEAFQVADAARSRALIEHLATSRNARRRGAAEQLVDAERLLRRIDALVELLQQADTVPERERSSRDLAHVNALARALTESRREYEAVLQRVEAVDPAGATLLGSLPTDVAAVRAALAADEALLHFVVAPERLVSFVVRRDTVHPIEVAVSAAEVATRARLAHDVAAGAPTEGQDAGAGASPALRALHELLIVPAEASGLLRGVRSLVLVPHASLVHVPFAALADSAGRYLAEDYALVMLPTASALPLARAPRHVARGRGRGRVFAPFPDRLPATRTEAAAVARRLPRAERLIGATATERALRRALSTPGVVHVASHGVLSESSPMFSRIEVAAPARRHPADDGRLEVHELLGMDVRSELVFLSGCETGAGLAWSTPFRRGQDYATLAQAFLYAGALDVIATLWRIEDLGASVFAERFYEELASKPPAAALAAAQRRMIRDPVYSAPRYWAGYTLSGSGSGGSPSISRSVSVRFPNRSALNQLGRQYR